MFEYVKGELVSRHPTHLVVEVAGVAYRLWISLSTYRTVPTEGRVQLWVYSRITDEQLHLYGFASEQERDLFALMVDTVPNLGPRRALGILSNMGGSELLEAVRRGEVGRLKTTKGIGEKLASRLIVELRGKLPEKLEGSGSGVTSLTREAVLALVSLGYAHREAEEAVSRATRNSGPNATLEELIKRSLEHV